MRKLFVLFIALFTLFSCGNKNLDGYYLNENEQEYIEIKEIDNSYYLSLPLGNVELKNKRGKLYMINKDKKKIFGKLKGNKIITEESLIYEKGLVFTKIKEEEFLKWEETNKSTGLFDELFEN